MAKTKQKKQFHKICLFRLDEDIISWLARTKKGTWNYTFRKIKNAYEEANNRHDTVSGEERPKPHS